MFHFQQHSEGGLNGVKILGAEGSTGFRVLNGSEGSMDIQTNEGITRDSNINRKVVIKDEVKCHDMRGRLDVCIYIRMH
jgi:hypothetical protein